ncbi:ABC transporter substrate-binding protein [Burkholderia sp. AU16741]|uniref:iron-siderophore ABC transporter substrate-binding protein n=1 Tax=Burkholderia sp. AU16741 TaxID=2015347 RepID=UPI000B7ACDB4|nr:iron-siderophore ABC transporter substrate-binding protein [Burkholderia sp. AU16741]OXI29835.1 ABC transporter substrate-binding protein [Burkholderia sp. AU16741]
MKLLVANPRRRQLLVALAALAGLGPQLSAQCVAAAATRVPHRIVVLNWELTETLLALGRAPVGIPLPDWYASGIVTPPLPPGVADVGLLYQPNFEVLLALAPDLIIVTPAHAALMTPLRRIAPTLTLGTYMNAARPLEVLCDETSAMARAIDAPQRATELIAAAQREFVSVAARIANTGARPARAVIVAEALDERHLRVYGTGSLFDDVLARIGVDNAAHPRDATSRAASTPWRTSVTGSATVALERLFDVPHADILLIGPLRAAVRAALNQNPLWRALPAVREKRVAVLPVIAAFGGLVSMRRFAAAVSIALATPEHDGGGLA